jgi:predicted dehydrogenase
MARVRSSPVTGSPLGVAVVGVGYWGPNLIRNFLGHPATDLQRVCDLAVDHARTVVGGRSEVQVTDSLDDVLNDDAVDAVAIATPPSSHHEIGMRCLEAGKHILVEKPLAMSSKHALEMVETAERHELVLMCDHTFCYTPAVKAIRELVRSGSVGDIQYIDSIRVNLGLVQSDVDVLWDLAPHDLSIMDSILPDDCFPIEVAAHGADPIGAGQSCVGYLTIPMNTGAIAHVTVSWLSPSKVRQTIVSGSKKMIMWDDMKPYQRLAVFDWGVDIGPPADDERERLMVNYRRGDMMSPALPETVEALHFVVEELSDAIRERRAPLTDGRSGLRMLEILEAANVSRQARGVLVPIEHR